MTGDRHDRIRNHIIKSPRQRRRATLSVPLPDLFLSLALLAVVAVPLWTAELTGWFSAPLALPGYFWHQHELVFAFLNAGIAGFLLTAVCVWTGTERLHGLPLMGLWLVWLAGRLVMGFGAELPAWVVMAVNLAFLPLVMVDAGWRIWHGRQKRQLVLLLVIGLVWLMQLGFFLQPHGPYVHGALIVAAALMLVIGGRITPNFSKAWLRQQGLPGRGPHTVPWLEITLLIAMAMTLVGVLTGLQAVIVIAAGLAAPLSLARTLLWRGWEVRGEPLLWMLHLSLLWIPLGLALLAGSAAGWWPATAWIHALGVGAMGGLILGVISRVALGHTGRTLKLPAGMTAAFVVIHIAALARVATGLGDLPWQAGIGIAGTLWTVAFGLFLVRYTGILAGPRADGAPG
ncbi:uncharacterized protein involved in response to NO [Natronocella acetinitrilica]|uniref:Uncharacterized protein involved in response to NO n=1 Tax=Natronocella acetinitrilica TaxID=414046 RepID=A0AAE3G8J3_9GAMM|nr:uncharacterized protein involved in response to NO [Natronocella acetinitrilica]